MAPKGTAFDNSLLLRHSEPFLFRISFNMLPALANTRVRARQTPTVSIVLVPTTSGPEQVNREGNDVLINYWQYEISSSCCFLHDSANVRHEKCLPLLRWAAIYRTIAAQQAFTPICFFVSRCWASGRYAAKVCGDAMLLKTGPANVKWLTVFTALDLLPLEACCSQ